MINPTKVELEAAKVTWEQIGFRFEEYYEEDYVFGISGLADNLTAGLCFAIGKMPITNRVCSYMLQQLKAFANYEQSISSYWFVRDRENAGIRSLIAYFLAEIGDDLL